jgi:ATP-dependent metalloprotease
MAPIVDMSIVARGTPGYSGADLANLVNQAALHASKTGAKQVGLSDLEWAKDKINMGAERKTAVITEKSKRLTAYHEGGHALVALYTSGSTPLHKVTIMPRGQALGVTFFLPEDDVTGYSRKELLAQLDVSMGGRVAEEILLGPEEVTTGASSDLNSASRIAKGMVTRYGMTDAGLVTHTDKELSMLSGAQRSVIDTEIKKLLEVRNTF